MSILDHFIACIQGIAYQSIQLYEELQPILNWMHYVIMENVRLDLTVKNLRLSLDLQSYELKSLQEENAYLRRSVSTATIELEQLHLKYRDPRDDIDCEAETVIL